MGYARMENGTPFYSKDCFWWSGVSIPHTEKDEHCGYRASDNRPIFADDIVTFTPTSWFKRKQYYLVRRVCTGWELKQLFSERIHPLSLLDYVKGLKVVGHGFLQSEFV